LSHIRHTIERRGVFYYNRRTPKSAVEIYGPSIRLSLGSDRAVAEALADRLSSSLGAAFKSGQKIDLRSILASMEPKRLSLSEIASEYLELRAIDSKPT
jgi:hypothetical protein